MSSRVTLDAVSPRHAALLSQVWFNLGLSRSDLHARTGTRLRTIGSLVEEMVSWGLIEEGVPRTVGVGRPQVPLVIAPMLRNMIGVSVRPHRVVVVKAGLGGAVLQTPTVLVVKKVDELIPAAAQVIRGLCDEQTLGMGVALTGFVDDAAGEWLLSAAHPAQDRMSLKPLIKAARDIPVCISNELHAMSAAARLAGRLPSGDSLLVHLEDGRVAASILVNGKPNQGCVVAANELGHTTMPVKVKRCYCGQVGCIERIFSSEYLKSRGCSGGFEELLSTHLTTNGKVKNMVDLLCRTVANAVNFVRPATLILSSPFSECREFVQEFEKGVALHTLGLLHERLKVVWQKFDPDLNAICAASLPMARLFEGTSQ